MKEIRNIDSYGRIVLPSRMRDALGWFERVPGKSNGDTIEVELKEDCMILRKISNRCKLCGSEKDLHDIYGIMVCNKCAENIYRKVNEKDV